VRTKRHGVVVSNEKELAELKKGRGNQLHKSEKCQQEVKLCTEDIETLETGPKKIQ
jgi:hypothetical protein